MCWSAALALALALAFALALTRSDLYIFVGDEVLHADSDYGAFGLVFETGAVRDERRSFGRRRLGRLGSRSHRSNWFLIVGKTECVHQSQIWHHE